MEKKDIWLDEKELQKLESVTAYEMLDKARELHTKITNLVIESELPLITVIAVLESVKNNIFKLVDVISTMKMLKEIEKDKGGDE